jgi:hypothetical protein
VKNIVGGPKRDMGGKALNVKIQLIVYSLQDNNQLYW